MASIVAIFVSVLGMAGVVGTMVFFPYEPEISSGVNEDEPKEDASAVQEPQEEEPEQEKSTGLNEVIKQYEAGNFDYNFRECSGNGRCCWNDGIFSI